MVQRKKSILLFSLLISIFLFKGTGKDTDCPVSYWLWAGITSKDVPSNSELYVYQGFITAKAKSTTYQRIGLYPHPIQSKSLSLVYRLEGELPDADTVVSIFQKNCKQWHRHSVKIIGLQLDFDAPTSKLLIYSDFLKQVRDKLPKHYALTITGLGDWAIYGNKQAMQLIAQATDEIVFQLYQGWHPLPNIKDYVDALKKYPWPFRIGLLSRYPNRSYPASLGKNSNFRGIIYFIQRDS